MSTTLQSDVTGSEVLTTTKLNFWGGDDGRMNWKEINFIIAILLNGEKGENVVFDFAHFSRSKPDPDTMTTKLNIDPARTANCVKSIYLSGGSFKSRIHLKNIQYSVLIVSNGKTVEETEFELIAIPADTFFIHFFNIVPINVKRTAKIGNPDFLRFCNSGRQDMALSIPLIIMSILVSIKLLKLVVNLNFLQIWNNLRDSCQIKREINIIRVRYCENGKCINRN